MLKQPPQVFVSTFWIRQLEERISKSGAPYYAFDLEDATGTLTTFVWKEKLCIAVPLINDALIKSCIRTAYHRGMMVAELLYATQGKEIAALSPVFPAPASDKHPRPEALVQLKTLRAKMKNPALSTFIDEVLKEDHIAVPFYSAPASLKHHHNFPGGLLVHSVETAKIVSRFKEVGSDTEELGIVAALFHDIGKIRVLDPAMKRTPLGYVVHHDALTLEILAPALLQLEKYWNEGATALRYLWSWKNHKGQQSTPLMVIAEAVQAADRISSGINIEAQAYAGLPRWRQSAALSNQPHPQRFWRPRTSEYHMGKPS